MERGVRHSPPPLRDPEEGIVRPIKRSVDPAVGEDALLILVGEDLKALLDLTRARERTSHDMGYFRVYRLERDKGPPFSISGPFLGAPHAVMGMEKIIALGARKIWVLGWCGSIHSDVKTGDFILPTHALPEEGTSGHYPIGERVARSDEKLMESLEKEIVARGRTFRKGPVWTTDAPYRETPSKVVEYGRRGILAVEMEMSALMTLAIYRSVRMAGLLVVSDELFDLKWRPGFRSPLFREARLSAAQLLLNLLESLDETSLESF